MRLKHPESAVLAAATVLVLLFWKLRLFDPATHLAFVGSDLLTQLYPMWFRLGRWTSEPGFALWNPYQAFGHPVLASLLYGVLYPLNLARLVLPAHVAMEVTLVLHLCLAWAFMYAYARFGLRVVASGATVAATAFALGGFVVGESLWFLPALSAVVWVPLAFLAIDRLIAEPRLRWSALLAAAIAMPVLAGWMQTWLHMMHALALYFIVRLVPTLRSPDGRRMALRVVACLAIGAALGAGLAAVQLFPTMELQQLGWRRPGGLSIEQQVRLSGFGPSTMLKELIAAEPGHPPLGYAGMAALLLAPLALTLGVGVRASALALASVLLWSLLVAMSYHTPAFAIYRALPGGTLFRIPARMILFYTFALAALSGLAVDEIARREGRCGADSWRVLAGVALPLSLLAILPPRAGAFLLSALVLIVAAFYLRRPAWRAAAFLGLVGVVAIDLFFATLNVAQRPYHNLAAFDGEIEAFSYIQEHQGLDRTYVHARWGTKPRLAAKQATLRGIYSLSDYEVLSLDRHANYCRAMDPDPRPIAERTPFVGDCYLNPTLRGLHLLSWLGVRYIIAEKSASDLIGPLAANGWKRIFTSTRGATAVYESPRVLPRAYVAYNYVVAQNPASALQMMQRLVVNPWRLIVIERDSETPTWVEDRSVSGPAIEPARILHYSPTHVEVEARAESSGFLVLTDSFYPGWDAWVDGERVPIQRVNYLFRGVPLPAGTHRITFRFAPTSVLVGAGVSVVSLLACAAAVVRG